MVAVAAVLVLAVGLRWVVFDVFSVTSGEMLPAIAPGQTVLTLRWSHGEPGDVVVWQADDRPILGRIIATAGQRVRLSNNNVFVDGQSLAETGAGAGTGAEKEELGKPCALEGECRCACDLQLERLRGKKWTAQALQHKVLCQCMGHKASFMRINAPDWPPNGQPFRVPDGHVFVLGDNRDFAVDSRDLGVISVTSIRGKVLGAF